MMGKLLLSIICSFLTASSCWNFLNTYFIPKALPVWLCVTWLTSLWERAFQLFWILDEHRWFVFRMGRETKWGTELCAINISLRVHSGVAAWLGRSVCEVATDRIFAVPVSLWAQYPKLPISQTPLLSLGNQGSVSP
jgi:hypothetical protein